MYVYYIYTYPPTHFVGHRRVDPQSFRTSYFTPKGVYPSPTPPQPPYSLGFCPGRNSSWPLWGTFQNNEGAQNHKSASKGSVRTQQNRFLSICDVGSAERVKVKQKRTNKQKPKETQRLRVPKSRLRVAFRSVIINVSGSDPQISLFFINKT